jgi:hypothetical protein
MESMPLGGLGDEFLLYWNKRVSMLYRTELRRLSGVLGGRADLTIMYFDEWLQA